MRLIGLLLTLAILGYVIKIYLGTSSVSTLDGDGSMTRPQQTIEHAEQATQQLNQVLQDNQQRLDDVDK